MTKFSSIKLLAHNWRRDDDGADGKQDSNTSFLYGNLSLNHFWIHRVGGCPLFGQPSSHTTVRTVRYTAVQWITCSTSYYLPIPDIQIITDIYFVYTVSAHVFQYCIAQRSLSAPGFHPTPLSPAGSRRFLLSSRCPYLPSTLETSLCSALRFTFTRLFHGHRSSLLWPLLTSCNSAIHCCIGSCPTKRRSKYLQDLPG
jgi:hypothetical protein